MRFNIVDVFAEAKYQGNQLAVFRDVGGISGEEMQLVAREMNFSETTFIVGEDAERRTFGVRIFTPAREVPFAGHPTLGTAYVIQRLILSEPVEEIVLDVKAGRIPVRISYRHGAPDVLWMKQLSPTFGRIHEPGPIAEFLGLSPGDIDPRFPVQEVSTGLPFFIVPVRTGAALRRARADKAKLLRYVEGTEAKAPLIFCPEPRSREHHLEARMFGVYYGIEEDPATGSGNGCLAGYLAKYRYFGEPKVDVMGEQGYEVGRPSLLYLRSEDNGSTIDVRVGGKAVMIAEGELI